MLVPECSEVLSISHWWVQSSCPGHIHIEALTCSRTNLHQKKYVAYHSRFNKKNSVKLSGSNHSWASMCSGHHPPQQETHCRGRNFHRHSDEVRCRGCSGHCKTLPGCRCHGGHPRNRMSGDISIQRKVMLQDINSLSSITGMLYLYKKY